MLLGRRVGRGDQEDEIRRAVRRAEVDARREAGEGERRLADGRALGVRDGDAARQAGLVGLLALPDIRRERRAVARATGRGHAGGERVDDGSFVGAERLVKADERRRDDLGHGDLRWSCLGGRDGQRRLTGTSPGRRSSGVGACVPGRAAAAEP